MISTIFILVVITETIDCRWFEPRLNCYGCISAETHSWIEKLTGLFSRNSKSATWFTVYEEG